MPEEGTQDSVAPFQAESKKEEVEIQYVIVTLADGRKGVFVGPKFVTAVELSLNPPKLVSVDFSLPKPSTHGVDNGKETVGAKPDPTIPKIA